MNTNVRLRILSLLLALVMATQLLPVDAFAAAINGENDPAALSDDADAAEEEAEDAPATQPEAELPAQEPEAEPVSEETEPAQEPTQAEEEDGNTVAPEEPDEAATDTVPEEPAADGEAVAEQVQDAPAAQAEAEAVSEEPVQVPSEAQELTEEELRERQIMEALDAELAELNAHPRRADAGSYASELARFPASYQTLLKTLHSKHPNWVFVAVDTGLDWNSVIAAEGGTNSTMEYNEGPNNIASHLLLNNRNGYYDPDSYSGTRHYKPVDGRFVSASRAAIAYYMDPRNFLTENYVFMFESETFSNVMQTSGVTAILRKGCNTSNGLANKTTYVTTGGKTANLSALSSQFGKTYPEIIYNVGKLTDVSPYFIASKIVQETSADTTTSVLRGTIDGYTGYYNFFNIGAYADANGKAYLNGLKYAKNHGWSNPILAIKGGVEFLSEKYISKGQNTAYYMRFNVSPQHSYSVYTHQYMSATAAAAGEGSSTFKGYQDAGALESPFLFYIPVYKNMPDKTATVSLTPATTGKTTAQEILYSAPSATGTKLVTVPKGSAVTVLGGSVTSSEVYINRLYFPYWYQVKVTVSGKSYTGYIHEQSVRVNQVYHIKTNSTKSISSVTKVTGYSGPVYYESSDPSVATVTATTGLIKAVGSGSCTIYAISGGGSFDAIGVKVSSSGTASSDKEGSGPSIGTPGSYVVPPAISDSPVLTSALAINDGVQVKWAEFPNAESYNVYRKTSGSGWKLVANTFTNDYLDWDVESNTQYTYTVRAYVNGALTGFDKTGISILFLETPLMESAEADATGVTVTWQGVSGAAGYRVYRRISSGTWALLTTLTSGKTTTYRDTDSALKAGNEYIYTVRAINGSQRSYYDTAGASVILFESVNELTTPKLTAISNVPRGVQINWDTVPAAGFYRVYRKSGGSSWQPLGNVTTPWYLDTAVTSNTSYTYTVRAFRGTKYSGFRIRGLTILHLSTPELVSADASSRGITLQWKAVTGAKGYRIYRRSGGGSWSIVKNVGNITSYTDNSGLVIGTRYIYTVRAFSGNTFSSYVAGGVSSIAGATLSTPALVSASNTADGIRFQWKAVSGAKNYRIYRRVNGSVWSILGYTTSLSYLDKNVTDGSNYTYTVRALSGSDISSYNNGLTVRRLSVPKLLSTSADANGITLKWNAVTGANRYWVFRRLPGESWELLQAVTSTSLTDNKGLIKGKRYIYTVRAQYGSSVSYYNATGLSATAAADGAEVLVSYVTTGTLNYRTGAGTSYPLGGTFRSGEKVQVVKGAAVNVGSTAWYRVKVNGSYYYASSKYLKAA